MLAPSSTSGTSAARLEGVSLPLVPDEVSRPFRLEQFQDHLAVEKGASPRTSEAYLRDIERFATF